MKEGETGRGRAWSKRRGKEEGGSWEAGRSGQDRQGEEGREGLEGGRHQCSVPGMVMHRSMPVVVSIHSVLTCWREGFRVVGRARRGPEKEGGTSCC